MSDELAPPVGACRACGSTRLYEVLDMGHLPLAGDFLPVGEQNRRYPLVIDGCADCTLLQVRQTVDTAVLFNPDYSYASSTVPGLVRHFERYAAGVRPAGPSRPRLLEIGCNDGVFLDPLRRVGYDVVGVDASANVVEQARRRGLDVELGVFDRGLAEKLLANHGPFDVVTCSNVFAHNPNVNDFIEGMNFLLAEPHGEIWIEVHSAERLFSELQWDCFYHEHCFYWTAHSLQACLADHGFRLRRMDTTRMHGGALRARFSRVGESVEIKSKQLRRADWKQFADESRRSRQVLREVIAGLGITYAYGAAGRAVTLINWTNTEETLEFVVDGSPLRHGRAIPGTTVPIISEDDFFASPPPSPWCFVTAHNYLDDIRRRVEERFTTRHVAFVTPLPHVLIR